MKTKTTITLETWQVTTIRRQGDFGMAVVIQDKVGRMCINLAPDVTAIQDALNRVPLDQGGTPPHKKLPPNGNCGSNTLEAIQLFQLKQFGWSGADGKIFPGGETIVRLHHILSNGPPAAQIPSPASQPEPEPTTTAFIIRMSTGGIDKTLISELDTLFLLIEDAANELTAIYRVLHFFGKKEESPPPFQKFGLPEPMAWSDPAISVNDFENAGFHYISLAASTRAPLAGPDVARMNTMIMYLHADKIEPEKKWFMMRKNTIMRAYEQAFRAAEEGKYGIWCEARIEGRIERVG